MTQEEKELLLKDLCARLPYGVMVEYESNIYVLNEIDPACKDIDYIDVRIQDVERTMCAKSVMIENIKPYLRPMSSITEKEKEEIKPLFSKFTDESGKRVLVVRQNKMTLYQDWLNAHHFDYRDLIPKGLAIEAPKDMYKLK